MTVPPLPPGSLQLAELVQRHRDAHDSLAVALSDASPEVRQLFLVQQRRLVTESLAYVQPVVSEPRANLLVVPPRAFLSTTQQRRMIGANAAFRHIDSRVTMLREGLITEVVLPSTPLVLHALLETASPKLDQETNPGMLRATLTSWLPEANDFAHPAAHLVEALVAEAIDVAVHADAPACVRAAWLTFVMLSIHPFVDGNGRTSRALYMAVVGNDLPLGVDWAALEMWSVYHNHYVDALQAGQQVAFYDPQNMAANTFVDFATRMSTMGADLCRERLDAISLLFEDRLALGLPRPHALVVLTVMMHRMATLTEVATCGLDDPEIDGVVSELLEAGVLRWEPRPASRRTSDLPDTSGLVVA